MHACRPPPPASDQEGDSISKLSAGRSQIPGKRAHSSLLAGRLLLCVVLLAGRLPNQPGQQAPPCLNRNHRPVELTLGLPPFRFLAAAGRASSLDSSSSSSCVHDKARDHGATVALVANPVPVLTAYSCSPSSPTFKQPSAPRRGFPHLFRFLQFRCLVITALANTRSLSGSC